MHLCFGATHAPHHVPKEWADRYAGQFDDGWDAYRERVFARQKEIGLFPADAVLSRHDPDVPEWESLSPEARRLSARMMEVFAGFLSHTDHHLGRLLDYLEETGQLDNTIVMVISDNGASAEGGPTGTTNEAQFFNNAQESVEDSLAAIDELGGPNHFNHYPWGWTWAGNTPFRRWKRETYRGGSTDPFIVSWRAGLARGEVRTQYAHIIDMVPTVLDLLGLQPPASIRGITQSPLHGVSLAPALDDARRRATTTPSTSRCSATAPSTTTAGGPCARGPDLRSPRPGSASATDLVRQAHRARRHRLGAVPRRRGPRRDPQPRRRAPRPADRHDRHLVRGSRQVRRDARRRQRPGRIIAEKPTVAEPRDRFIYRPTPSPSRSTPRRGCSTARTASRAGRDPRRRRRGRPGVPGHRRRGYSFYVKDGRLHYVHNYVGRGLYGVSSPDPLPAGATSCASSSNRPAPRPRTAKARRDGSSSTSTAPSSPTPRRRYHPVHVQPRRPHLRRQPRLPVTPDYTALRFTGTIHTVTVDVSGELIHDPEAELRAHMARQ